MNWVPFHCSKEGLCQGLVVPLWLQGLTWRVGLTPVQVAKKSAGCSVSASSTDARKEATGAETPDVSKVYSLLIFGFSGWYAIPFLDQCRSITSNRLVLNMVRGYHFQLRSCPPFFCNFSQFNTRAAAVHHPIIQEVDKLFLRQQLNHLLVVLLSTPVCLLLLNILVTHT